MRLQVANRRARLIRAVSRQQSVKRRRTLLAVLVGVVAVTVTGTAVMALGTAGVLSSRPGGTQPEAAEAVPSGIQNRPPQAAGLVYDNPESAAEYAVPGGLVVAGRDNFQGKAFKEVSAAGGTVLIYLDAVIDNSSGRYHEMLFAPSICGPATARWPGDYRANSWGYLTDFRVGSVLQNKLECVLERMVAENPHMGGWFADDIGSRFWFPGIDWAEFPDQAAYRAGAIALTQTFRTVANRHHLIFLVNGTWAGGSLASEGGGWPNPAKSGNALADGGVVEHHDGEIDYFGPYGCSTQWASQSPVTKGKAFNYAVTSTAAGTSEYLRSSCYAFVNHQTDFTSSRRWGKSHPTGLPNRVR